MDGMTINHIVSIDHGSYGGCLKMGLPSNHPAIGLGFSMKSTIQLLGYSHLQYENLHN